MNPRKGIGIYLPHSLLDFGVLREKGVNPRKGIETRFCGCLVRTVTIYCDKGDNPRKGIGTLLNVHQQSLLDFREKGMNPRKGIGIPSPTFFLVLAMLSGGKGANPRKGIG